MPGSRWSADGSPQQRAETLLFLSGNHGDGEYRDGNEGPPQEFFHNAISMIPAMLSVLRTLATAVQDKPSSGGCHDPTSLVLALRPGA